jgi:hypothetical protein
LAITFFLLAAFFTKLSPPNPEHYGMPRANRIFIPNQVYEIIPRARQHLPMPPTQVSNEIKIGILARTQRDNKVDLCHFIDMNNHSHNLAVSTTETNLSKFYMETMKKTTEAVKALLGIPHLSLWESRAGVFRIADLAATISRIAYIYANPAKADLCNSIEEYPGLSSWTAFLTCEPAVDAEVTIHARWYPVSEIHPLPARSISPAQDAALYQALQKSDEAIPHTLVLKPFKWLEPFGIREPERIENIRKQLIARVRELEKKYADKRAEAKTTVVPRSVQLREPYMKPHTPQKKERKIHIICSDKTQRIELLQEHKEILSRCKECYQKAKEGLRVDWPPGTFVPWFPPGFTFPLPKAA